MIPSSTKRKISYLVQDLDIVVLLKVVNVECLQMNEYCSLNLQFALLICNIKNPTNHPSPQMSQHACHINDVLLNNGIIAFPCTTSSMNGSEKLCRLFSELLPVNEHGSVSFHLFLLTLQLVTVIVVTTSTI